MAKHELTDAKLEEAEKALKSLIKHVRKEGKRQPVYLIITLYQNLAKKREFVPRIVPLPHKIGKVSEKKICLVTKDPCHVYREQITKDKEPTEVMFTEILSVKKLKSRLRSAGVKALMQEWDMIMADERVIHLLPEILGKPFYKSHKMVPFMVRMQPAKDDGPYDRRKVNGLPKEETEKVDTKYLAAQAKAIAKATSLSLNPSTTTSVKIGFTDTDIDKLLDNALSVLKFLTDTSKSNQMLGGGFVKDRLDGIHVVHVKTPTSASLPFLSWPKATQ